MARRPIWRGTLTLGLVPIPVSVHSVKTTRSGTGLGERHEDCGGKVGRKKYCKKCGELLGWNEPVKGELVNENGDEELLIYTDAEIDSMYPEGTREIKIEAFIPRTSHLDIMERGQTYYLLPTTLHKNEKVPESTIRGFKLLLHLLKHTDRVALVRTCRSGKEHLAILEYARGNVIMRNIAFSNDVRWDELDNAPDEYRDVDLPPEYIELGNQLIATRLNKPFEVIHDFRDTFNDRLAEIREQKLTGVKPRTPLDEREKHHPDLFAALRASVEEEITERQGR